MAEKQPEGYLATARSKDSPGVLVLHPWWGLNSTIKTFCDRLAEAGFTAFAPDLYHGKVVSTIPEAEEMSGALFKNHVQAAAEVAEATHSLAQRLGERGSDLSVIGFSMGAYYALDLSAAQPEHIRKAVVFYGTGPADFGVARAAYLGHFAENDPFEPSEGVDELEQAIKAAGRPVKFYKYSGTGHWFFEPDRKDAYNEAAAKLAWERTLAFLKEPSAA